MATDRSVETDGLKKKGRERAGCGAHAGSTAEFQRLRVLVVRGVARNQFRTPQTGRAAEMPLRLSIAGFCSHFGPAEGRKGLELWLLSVEKHGG